MDSKLRERFGRLGPIRAVGRVSSGSPATIKLRLPADHGPLGTVDAALALARHGLSLLEAKRAIETVLQTGSEILVSLPLLEDVRVLQSELTHAGFQASRIDEPPRLEGGAVERRRNRA